MLKQQYCIGEHLPVSQVSLSKAPNPCELQGFCSAADPNLPQEEVVGLGFPAQIDTESSIITLTFQFCSN